MHGVIGIVMDGLIWWNCVDGRLEGLEHLHGVGLPGV